MTKAFEDGTGAAGTRICLWGFDLDAPPHVLGTAERRLRLTTVAFGLETAVGFGFGNSALFYKSFIKELPISGE